MRKILVIALLFTLSGCQIFDSISGPYTGPDKPTGPIIVTPPVEPQPDPDEIIPPPQIKTIDWPVSFESVTEAIIGGSPIKQDNVLLVDDVKNNANVELNTLDLTSQLKQLIASTHRFTTPSEEQVAVAKQSLGLQNEDSLNARNKTIGLARYLTVPYILYTTIDGQDPQLVISSQIMQVQTGELIWSEKMPVKLN